MVHSVTIVSRVLAESDPQSNVGYPIRSCSGRAYPKAELGFSGEKRMFQSEQL
jgi:hypothetical protein